MLKWLLNLLECEEVFLSHKYSIMKSLLKLCVGDDETDNFDGFTGWVCHFEKQIAGKKIFE